MYTDTFIEVAPDSQTTCAIVPDGTGAKTIHRLQYELLTDQPYTLSNEELIFEVHVRRLGLSQPEVAARRRELWDALFSKPHPCMRASALTKKYGWGVHYDSHSKMALYASDSSEYKGFVEDGVDGPKRIFAMRSKRG